VKTEENISMAGLNLPNAIILNSMSKVFRIPGLRIGFVIAPEQIINAFLSYYLPWSVNSLAQEAVTYIYSNRNIIGGFLEEIRAFTEKETALFRERLQDCPGITLFPTSTSFVLGKLEHKTRADGLLDALAKERILVRNCSNFTGLSNDYVRFSLKDETTNLKLAELIKRILN
jgi:threonine-phosphate decarboxylase